MMFRRRNIAALLRILQYEHGDMAYSFCAIFMNKDGNGSDTHGNGFGYLRYLFSYFLSVSIPYDGNGSDTYGNGFVYLGYPFSCLFTISIPIHE